MCVCVCVCTVLHRVMFETVLKCTLCTLCVCLFSALSRRVGDLEMCIIIILKCAMHVFRVYIQNAPNKYLVYILGGGIYMRGYSIHVARAQYTCPEVHNACIQCIRSSFHFATRSSFVYRLGHTLLSFALSGRRLTAFGGCREVGLRPASDRVSPSAVAH